MDSSLPSAASMSIETRWVEPKVVMTIESLLSYGFKEYNRNAGEKHDRNWQFCLRTKEGKKLFVDVRLWEFSRYSTPENKVQDSFDAKCQFDMNGPKTFNVDISVNDMTPAQVVEWFNDMFNKMSCTYYERYDEDDRPDSPPGSCVTCKRWLPPANRISPYLCEECKYELESGFKPFVPTKRKTR